MTSKDSLTYIFILSVYLIIIFTFFKLFLLLKFEAFGFRLVEPRSASVSELAAFHSMDYIECLEQVTNCSDCEEIVDIAAAEYGIGKHPWT